MDAFCRSTAVYQENTHHMMKYIFLPITIGPFYYPCLDTPTEKVIFF